jgi:tetratricopeptide (TPR) repeat protein
VKTLLNFYRRNTAHIDILISALGILAAIAGGLPLPMLAATVVVVLGGTYIIGLLLSRPTIAGRNEIEALPEMLSLADDVLSPRIQDDDSLTRIYCEAVLYNLERSRFNALTEQEKSDLLYALSIVYMRLLIFFAIRTQNDKVRDLLGRIDKVEKLLAKSPGQRATETLDIIHFTRAYAEYRANHYEATKRLLDQCLSPQASQMLQSRARDLLGSSHTATLDFQRAEANYQLSLEIKRQVDDKLGQAITLGNLGRLHMAMFQFAEAINAFKQNIAISEGIGNARGVYQSYNHIGMSLLHLQDPKGAIAAFEASFEASKVPPVSPTSRQQNQGFLETGLWLAYQLLGESTKAYNHYNRSKDAFHDADFQLGLNNLSAYQGGLEAINGNEARLRSTLAESAELLTSYPEKALFFRLMQVFCNQQNTQQIALNVARQYFATLHIDIYQARFVPITTKKLETYGWLTSLPAPFDFLLYGELHQDSEGSVGYFFSVVESFMKFLSTVIRAKTPTTITDFDTTMGRASLGMLVRQIITDANTIDITNHPFADILSRWVYKNKRHFDKLVNTRNSWAHPRFGIEEQASDLAELRKDWILRMSDLLSVFQTRLGNEIEAYDDFAEYILVLQEGSRHINLSPFYYLSRADSTSAWVFEQVKNDNLIYRNSVGQAVIEVPTASVIRETTEVPS